MSQDAQKHDIKLNIYLVPFAQTTKAVSWYFLAKTSSPLTALHTICTQPYSIACVTYSLMKSNTDPLWKQGYCFTVHSDPFPTLFQFKIRNLKVKDTERLLVFHGLRRYIICPPVLLSPIAQTSESTSPYLSFPSWAS